MVCWLQFLATTAGARIPSLVRELRSQMMQQLKQNNKCILKNNRNLLSQTSEDQKSQFHWILSWPSGSFILWMLWGRIYSFPLPTSGGSCITQVFQASHPPISVCSVFTSPSPPLCQRSLCLPPTCNRVEGLYG